jgi:hypothetical protein
MTREQAEWTRQGRPPAITPLVDALRVLAEYGLRDNQLRRDLLEDVA